MKVVAILLLAGLAQAEEEDLMIKMPEAVTKDIIKAGEKPQADLALVQQVETTQQLGMFQSGVLHASLKPIVKAKVKKVMNLIHDTTEEYEHGTEQQKAALQEKATSLINIDMGTRAYSDLLCETLWNEATEMAGVLSHYYCPGIVYQEGGALASYAPSAMSAMGATPSRLRSAYLSYYFFRNLISFAGTEETIDMLGTDVAYYWGAGAGLVGKAKVSKTLPYIGFPEDAWFHNLVEWKCDTACCLVPITGWSEMVNYGLSCFLANGKVSEVIIPLAIWR